MVGAKFQCTIRFKETQCMEILNVFLTMVSKWKSAVIRAAQLRIWFEYFGKVSIRQL